MSSLRHRSHEPEWMDGEGVSQQEFADCLGDLARVNTITLARPPTLAFIRRAILAAPAGRVPTIVDVGCGAGDMLRAIGGLLGRMRRPAQLIGYDINPRSRAVASALTPAEMAIDFRTGDAFAIDAGARVDLIVSSLVTHHMTDQEVVAFLRWMEERSALGWFVNDLHRHWLPWYGFRALSTAMRWHPFVRHDGPLSIARAFTQADWQALLDEAGLGDKVRLRWRFPFRYCVERRKW